VVQVRGTFTLPLEDGTGVRLKFERGGPSHIFAEVYRSLRELGDVERVVFDLSQGWNHLTVMAYIGALAYAEVNWVNLIPLTSMPVLVPSGRPPTRTRPSPDPYQEGLAGAAGRAVELPVDFMDVEEAQVIHGLVVTISKLLAHSRLSPGMIADIWENVVRREFDRYGNLEKGKELLKSLIRLRKVSCALDTTMLTYLHHALRSFSESLHSIREMLNYLKERMDRGDYVERLKPNPDAFAEGFDEIVIEYELEPPLSYPLADSVSSFALKIGIDTLNHHLRRDHASLRFAQEVRSLYRSLGMHPNEVLIARELAMIDRSGNLRSVNCMVREAPGGTALGYMRSYIEEMACEMVKKRIRGSVASVRDVYPFAILGRRCPDVVRDAYRETSKFDRSSTLVDLHEESLKWEIFRTKAVDLMENSSCKDDWWVRNFLSADKLMRGRDAVSPEEVSSLLRNLAVHVGLQHFSVRNLVPVLDRGGVIEDVEIHYYHELFEGLEDLASGKLRGRLDGMPEDLIREIGCLCDVGI